MTGLPLEFLFEPLLSVFVPGCPDAVVVFDLLSNQRVEDDGKLVCRGRDPAGRTQFGLRAAQEVSKRAAIVMERTGRHSEHLCGAVVYPADPSPQHFATALVIVGT
jgi:hypothetical protein